MRPGDDRESSVTSPSSSRDPNSWNSLPEPPSSAILELVADLSEEFSKREALMHALASEFAQKAVLTSSWLSRVDFGWGPERVKDVSKGSGTRRLMPRP